MPLISYPRTDGDSVLKSAKSSFRSTGYRPRSKKAPLLLKHAIGLIEFSGWLFQEISWTKRLDEEREKFRVEFNNRVRRKFLKTLAKDKKLLRTSRFSEEDIERLKKGQCPNGYQVHHKIPIDDGGTNDFDNLVLIKNTPYHETIHSAAQTYQSAINELKSGETVTVDFPVPEIGTKVWPLDRGEPVRVMLKTSVEGIKLRKQGLARLAERGIELNEEYI